MLLFYVILMPIALLIPLLYPIILWKELIGYSGSQDYLVY